MRPIAIAPFILSADFARRGEQVRDAEAAGADRIRPPTSRSSGSATCSTTISRRCSARPRAKEDP